MKARWTDINVYCVTDRKIVEEGFCGGYLGMMQPIRAVPELED